MFRARIFFQFTTSMTAVRSKAPIRNIGMRKPKLRYMLILSLCVNYGDTLPCPTDFPLTSGLARREGFSYLVCQTVWA